MPATVWPNVVELAAYLRSVRASSNLSRIILCSGGCDILHVGHARYLLAAGDLRNNFHDHLVVLVNSDDWLLRKKGYCVMSLAERMEVVAAISGVDHVSCWDDGTPTVAGAIRLLRPDVFAKGGDRSHPDNIAEDEKAACAEVGASLVLGVGGSDKANSSSEIVRRLLRDLQV
jgi:bifunctional ADP-heptose synthase (sugar kinase/adenylyltransferase)